MPLFIVLESTLVDRDGKPVLGSDGKPVDHIINPTNSWVKQFPQIMKSSMQEVTEGPAFDTSGASLRIAHSVIPGSEWETFARSATSFSRFIGFSKSVI